MPEVVLINRAVQALWHFSALFLPTWCRPICQNLHGHTVLTLSDYEQHAFIIINTLDLWPRYVSWDWACRVEGWFPPGAKRTKYISLYGTHRWLSQKKSGTLCSKTLLPQINWVHTYCIITQQRTAELGIRFPRHGSPDGWELRRIRIKHSYLKTWLLQLHSVVVFL